MKVLIERQVGVYIIWDESGNRILQRLNAWAFHSTYPNLRMEIGDKPIVREMIFKDESEKEKRL